MSLPAAADVGWRPSPRLLRRAALALAAVAVVGVSLGLLVGGPGHATRPAPEPGRGPTPLGRPAGPSPAERELRLKAALHDLVEGKTCPDRLAAVTALHRLGDKRAVPALKKARFRMRGGVMGIGDENTNACLRQAAESALADLDPEALRPTRPRR